MNDDSRTHDHADSARPATERANDHLANERTFLAWIRTALALIGFGFLMARFGLFLREVSPVATTPDTRTIHHAHEFAVTGAVFIALGTLLSAWSGWHYRDTKRAILRKHFTPADLSIIVVSAIAAIGGLAIMVLVLLGIATRR